MNDRHQHYFLRASSEFNDVQSAARKALTGLNFEFLQNKTEDLVELEVVSPRYFRIVIARRTEPEVQSLIMPSIKQAKGTSIEVRFDVDSGRTDDSANDAKLFLRTLMPLLPAPPWKGLRFRESGREKKRWLNSIS